MEAAGAVFVTYKTLFYELVERVEDSRRAQKTLLPGSGRFPTTFPTPRCDEGYFGRIRMKGVAPALGDQLVVLVVGAVVELDDAGARPRLQLALADHLGRAMHGVALEQRVGEFHVGHAEVGDGGADCHVGHLDADHQAEREQRVHQRLAPLGLLLAEVPVDVQRLRVERHVGEQHVVHLRHRAAVAVLGERADREILEIEAAARVALRGVHGGAGHRLVLLSARRGARGRGVKVPFTIIVNSPLRRASCARRKTAMTSIRAPATRR